MKRIIIEPGTGENKYYIRTTDLESYLNCPFKFKYENKIWNNYDIFDWGKTIHTYIQHLMLGGDDIELTRLITSGRSINEKQFITSLYTKLKEEDVIGKGLLMEYSMSIQFVFGDDSIILEGTMDMLMKDKSILDIKTASGDWNEFQIKSKKQWIIYSVLYSLLTNNLDNIQSFKYMLVIKNKTPKISWVNMECNVKEYYPIVLDWLREYIKSEKENKFEAKSGTIYCQWCELKKNGECPLYLDF